MFSVVRLNHATLNTQHSIFIVISLDKKIKHRLETIDLYTTNHWFVRYKPLICALQTYRLHRLNLWFVLRPIPNLPQGKKSPSPTLPQGKGALNGCESLIENCELLIVNCKFFILHSSFFPRPPVYLANYHIINGLYFSRPHVTPHVRPHTLGIV